MHTPERTPEPRDWLREYLAERHEPCPCCGYDLRGLTGGRCPECNEALVLSVRPAEPRLAWFVFGLVGLATGAGFHGIVTLWVLWIWAARGSGPPSGEVIPVFVLAPVQSAIVLLWVLRRRAIGRHGARARWWWASGAWVLTLAGAFWFFSGVR